MTQEEETEMLIRLRMLLTRVEQLAKCRTWPAITVIRKLLDACGVRKMCDIPLKVVPLAEQFIDRVVKDYGLPEV